MRNPDDAYDAWAEQQAIAAKEEPVNQEMRELLADFETGGRVPAEPPLDLDEGERQLAAYDAACVDAPAGQEFAYTMECDYRSERWHEWLSYSGRRLLAELRQAWDALRLYKAERGILEVEPLGLGWTEQYWWGLVAALRQAQAERDRLLSHWVQNICAGEIEAQSLRAENERLREQLEQALNDLSDGEGWPRNNTPLDPDHH